jgi:hypothetical protein
MIYMCISDQGTGEIKRIRGWLVIPVRAQDQDWFETASNICHADCTNLNLVCPNDKGTINTAVQAHSLELHEPR